MTPKPRSMPLDPLQPGQAPPRAPRGFVSIRIRGTAHMARRGASMTLCHRPTSQHERHGKPLAVCLTCAAAIAELTP